MLIGAVENTKDKMWFFLEELSLCSRRKRHEKATKDQSITGVLDGAQGQWIR